MLESNGFELLPEIPTDRTDLPVIRRIDTGSLELWELYQDVKRLQDLLSAYNLGLQVVDKLSNTVIELQFDITLEDG